MMTQSNQAALSALPVGVVRVQVTDEFGKTVWRAPHEVQDSDKIVLGQNGVPIHMTNQPGRPRKVPLLPANANVAEMMRQKEDFIEDDPLLHTVATNPEKSEVLDFVMKALAEEAASLGFERKEAERKGEATSQISMRRIGALKAVGDSWLKRKEQISSSGVDLDSPAFKRVFNLITETLGLALADAGLRPEMVETIFAAFSKRVMADEWDREALKRMQEG